jgi:hypothetical protein
MPPITENAFVENNLYEHGHYATFIPLYSDTVYCINDNLTYYPKYVVKQKKSIWSKKNESIKYQQVSDMLKTQSYTYLSPGMFMEAKHGIILGLSIGNNYGLSNKYYFYDKIKKNIYELETGMFKEKTDQVFPTFLSFTADNSFYGYYQDISVYKFLLDSNLLRKGKLYNIIKNSKKGDNPVLVEFKLKN